MADMSEEDVENTRVCGWHRCAGCRCFIHTAVMCGAVCEGGDEGVYLCGHRHALAKLPVPPLAGDDDDCSLPDNEVQDSASDSEDVLNKSKRSKQPRTQQGATNPRKKQRCGHCKELGHNKKTCKQR